MATKKFRLQDREGHDVLGGEVGEDNAYVRTYGTVVQGRPPGELEVDESCVKEYALSGQRPTRYWLVRTA